MGEHLRGGDGLAREETERADRRVGVGVQARRATSARVHPVEPVPWNRGPGVDDHEPAHALGMPRRERHRVVAAHRMPDDRHALPAQRVHDADEVTREVLGGVRGRLGPLALAVAALIERDHVEPVGERGRHQIEPVSVRRAAVQEAERGATRRAPLEEAQAEAVDLEPARPRGLAAEAW